MDTIETFLDNMFAPYPATPTSAGASEPLRLGPKLPRT